MRLAARSSTPPRTSNAPPRARSTFDLFTVRQHTLCSLTQAAAPDGRWGEVRTLAGTVGRGTETDTTRTGGRFDRGEQDGEVLYAPEARSKNLPPMEYADMPEPLPLRKVLGPSVILAGVGVGSGEYILWPYISTNAGIGFLWLAVVGVTLQYFLNMEIERYTLATGETAIAGFARYWKPWGLVFCVGAIVPNIWPGWGTAGATTFTYLVGGNPTTDRDHRLHSHRRGVDHLARGLQGAGDGGVLQGRPDDRVPGDRDRRGDRRLGLGRPGRQRRQPRHAADR